MPPGENCRSGFRVPLCTSLHPTLGGLLLKRRDLLRRRNPGLPSVEAIAVSPEQAASIPSPRTGERVLEDGFRPQRSRGSRGAGDAPRELGHPIPDGFLLTF